MLTGRKALIAGIRSNPLFRALRVDKLTYAALQATLLAYIRQDHDAIPALRMMRLPSEDVGRRARDLMAGLTSGRVRARILAGESAIGGGAAPGAGLPTQLLAISVEGLSADELARQLRLNQPPIIARIEEGKVLLDLRTVFPDQDSKIEEAIRRIA
jgi:L-seryl-tRNA(Ser) seleniumtransferase